MKLTLRVPSIREMEHRQKWLSDPATMSYNRGQDRGAEGYHRATGCIDFPPSDWRWWRDVWLWQEPDRYSAFLQAEDGTFVGEVCYFRDAESDACGTGVLIAAEHRHKGFGTAGLRLLAEHAFLREEISLLFAELPEEREDAVRMYLAAGFRQTAVKGGIARLELRKESHDRQ